MAKRKKIIEMSIEDYCKSTYNTDALTYNALTKRIRENKSLPSVRDYKKFSRFYILNVEQKEISE